MGGGQFWWQFLIAVTLNLSTERNLATRIDCHLTVVGRSHSWERENTGKVSHCLVRRLARDRCAPTVYFQLIGGNCWRCLIHAVKELVRICVTGRVVWGKMPRLRKNWSLEWWKHVIHKSPVTMQCPGIIV